MRYDPDMSDERQRDRAVEAPVPDLLDHRGRLRRMGVAAAAATLAAVVAALVTYGLAQDDIERASPYAARSTAAAWRFVIFFTALGWVATFVVVNWFLSRRQARRDAFVPPATIRRRPRA